MPTWFQLISGAASLIASLNQILGDNGRINEQLDEILRQLQAVRETLIGGIQQILQLIQTVFEEVDRAFCATQMGLADRAFHEIMSSRNQQAEDDSFQAPPARYFCSFRPHLQ